MVAKLPVPEAVPADLYGRRRHDRLLGGVDRAAAAYLGSLRFLRRRPPRLREVDDRIAVVVRARQVVAADDDVVTLTLSAPDGAALPSWTAGAHIDVELPSGRLRQYSLCGDPADASTYRIAVRRIPDGQGGSVEVHDALPVGTGLVIRGPRNAFAFAIPGLGSSSSRLHFIAGGIGITPILPMARLAERLGLDWSMVYTGRGRDTLPFLGELEEFGERVTVRTDDEGGLPSASELLPQTLGGTAVYCCGPPAMVDALRVGLGSAPLEFHYERFSAPPIVDGAAFELELARTGEVISVPPDRSALDAILQHRPDVAYSCRQGFCRTCAVQVLSGEPDHRDGTLTVDERAAGTMLPCVSRCRGGRLTLDL